MPSAGQFASVILHRLGATISAGKGGLPSRQLSRAWVFNCLGEPRGGFLEVPPSRLGVPEVESDLLGEEPGRKVIQPCDGQMTAQDDAVKAFENPVDFSIDVWRQKNSRCCSLLLVWLALAGWASVGDPSEGQHRFTWSWPKAKWAGSGDEPGSYASWSSCRVCPDENETTSSGDWRRAEAQRQSRTGLGGG